MNLKNKHVVITGGSDGLGLSLAKAFAKKGAILHLIARTEEKLESATKDIEGEVHAYVTDVSDYAQLESVANKIEQVDVLINNAGVWIEGLVEENSVEDISNAIDINLKGVIYATRAFLPTLKRSNEAHLINISSTSGLKGRDNQAVYVASKFGVTGFTESLKVDLASTNIKVSGFYPGGMSTQLFEKAGTPKDNTDWMDTDKVAEVLLFMIEQDASMMLDHVVLNKRKTKTSN